MLLSNPNRIQYHERYQAIIEDYNSQQDRANIDLCWPPFAEEPTFQSLWRQSALAA